MGTPRSVLFQLVDQFTAHSDVDSFVYSLHGLSIRWYPIIISVLIIPVGMVKLMKYLVPFSVAANACMLAGTAAVFYFIIIGDDSEDPIPPEEQAKLVVWPATRWTLFAGSSLCSLEGVGMVIVISYITHIIFSFDYSGRYTHTSTIKTFKKLNIIFVNLVSVFL